MRNASLCWKFPEIKVRYSILAIQINQSILTNHFKFPSIKVHLLIKLYRVNICQTLHSSGILQYHTNITKKQFLDTVIIFLLPWCFTLVHFLSLPCVYDRKHTFWEWENLPLLYTDILKIFLFSLGGGGGGNRPSITQLCGKSAAQLPAI